MKAIAGIDEAGRGCVGGSLFVCGCFSRLEDEALLDLGVKDSKLLSLKNREIVANKILTNKQIQCFCIKVDSKTIDLLGLSSCIKEALDKIILQIQSIDKSCKQIYIDGNTGYGLDLIPVIKGDRLIPIISTASIIAKYNKDLESKALHERMPHYCFNKHQGYATKLHIEMIKKYGLTHEHRKSYKIKKLQD